MHPICFELGGLTIRWYGVMAAVGFLLASLVVEWQRKKAGMTQDQGISMMLIAIVAGIVGARLFYVIQFFSQFRDNLWSVFRVDQGGLVFYGGFFLAIAGLIVYCLKQKLDILRVFDVLVPGLALGHAAGRIGCLLNGCCWGKPTECLLGVIYPAGSAPYQQYGGIALHPVQLYEAVINIAIFGILILLLKYGRRGVSTAGYLVMYGAMRFIDEFFRGDHKQFVSGLTPAQVIGLVMIPAGLALVIYFQRRKPAAAPAPPPEEPDEPKAKTSGRKGAGKKCRRKR